LRRFFHAKELCRLLVSFSKNLCSNFSAHS
jgi:hypothetical protein